MFRKTFYTLVCLFAGSSSAIAADCLDNYRSDGNGATGLRYSSWAVFANVSPKTAIERAKRALIDEGLAITRFDPARGEVIAMQDGANSGRPQTARITARKAGKATRVDAMFQVQPGQAASRGMIGYICRWVNSAGGN